MAYTLDLADAGGDDLALVGGKAANLGELVRAGFPVPPGFVVTTAAYAEFVAGAGLTGAHPEQLRERIPTAPLPEHIAAELVAGYRALGEPPVAVRSSGVAEDLADASFAGQHDTVLDVRGEQALLTAVRDCWASLWTPHAVGYRRRVGHDRPDLALAVVVQAMVDAEWAGVLFTADPVTGRRDVVVVEAVRGLGESLVSGTATGHRATLVKDEPPPDADSPVPRDVLTELGELGSAVERAFGAPQDVEWVYAAGRCALVQARPLTALPEPEPEAPLDIGAQQLADHMPYPPYPVDAALMLRPAFRAVTEFLRAAGFAVSDPGNVLVEGTDVVEVAQPGIRPTRRLLRGLPALVPKVAKVVNGGPEDWYAACERTLVPLANGALTDDLSGASDAELLDRVDAVVRAQAALLPTRFGYAVPLLLFTDPALKAVLRLATGHTDRDRLHTELLAGVATITGVANDELAEIAATIRQTPALAEIYREHDPEHVAAELGGLEAGRKLLDDVAGYLDRYGYRQAITPMPGFETLAETPHRVHAMLRGLAGTASGRSAAEGRDRAVSAARGLVRRGPRARVLAPLALRLAQRARAGVSFRENSHCLVFMLPAAAVRRLLLELGGRLVERGAVDAAADVVYLEPAEITTLPPATLHEVAVRRKKARAAALEPRRTGATGGSLRGIAASRGVVDGSARLVTDEDDFGKLAHGEVLVCPYTNPAWTPLFAVAGAVVTDAGGAASHAAVVAREYGIPAVMGTGSATTRLRDGDRIRVDGAAGTVRLLARDGAADGDLGEPR